LNIGDAFKLILGVILNFTVSLFLNTFYALLKLV
jgi:hypothetical protein